MHWDGHTWQTVPVPHTGSCPVTGIAPDGAGGIWVIPCQGNWLGAQYLHWQADRWTDVSASPPGPHSSETAQAIALVAVRLGGGAQVHVVDCAAQLFRPAKGWHVLT